MNVAGQRFVAN